MGTSGAGNSMSSFLYAEEMNELLDDRPIAIGTVVDSAPTKDLSDSEKNDDYSK